MVSTKTLDTNHKILPTRQKCTCYIRMYVLYILNLPPKQRTQIPGRPVPNRTPSNPIQDPPVWNLGQNTSQCEVSSQLSSVPPGDCHLVLKLNNDRFLPTVSSSSLIKSTSYHSTSCNQIFWHRCKIFHLIMTIVTLFLDKWVVLHLAKSPHLQNRTFITVFRASHHKTLSWARGIQPSPSPPSHLIWV
jgi:hypothetical protein